MAYTRTNLTYIYIYRESSTEYYTLNLLQLICGHTEYYTLNLLQLICGHTKSVISPFLFIFFPFPLPNTKSKL
ncbi:hypothetical protein OIU76_008587 [Salix suchowensis]|nr:hypothetical protein OIU76_008587 [Salix suchowensis]KAJ6361140.1 hypothetical protein OIU78_001726 [Salix suchowensis]